MTEGGRVRTGAHTFALWSVDSLAPWETLMHILPVDRLVVMESGPIMPKTVMTETTKTETDVQARAPSKLDGLVWDRGVLEVFAPRHVGMDYWQGSSNVMTATTGHTMGATTIVRLNAGGRAVRVGARLRVAMGCGGGARSAMMAILPILMDALRIVMFCQGTFAQVHFHIGSAVVLGTLVNQVVVTDSYLKDLPRNAMTGISLMGTDAAHDARSNAVGNARAEASIVLARVPKSPTHHVETMFDLKTKNVTTAICRTVTGARQIVELRWDMHV